MIFIRYNSNYTLYHCSIQNTIKVKWLQNQSHKTIFISHLHFIQCPYHGENNCIIDFLDYDFSLLRTSFLHIHTFVSIFH